MRSDTAEKTAGKYRGPVASAYEAKRAGKDKWLAEARVLNDMLRALAPATVLDIPCGTGRFTAMYQSLRIKALGLDISEDMLMQAEAKGLESRPGDIFGIELPDGSFDAVVAIRIMNLISADDMIMALGELQRVARKAVIFNLRTWRPDTQYKRAQRIETVQHALKPGWSIAEDREIHEPDFRMIRLALA